MRPTVTFNQRLAVALTLSLLLLTGCGQASQPLITANEPTPSKPTSTSTVPTPIKAPADPSGLVTPLANAQARLTKKFFGTYVTPKASPVQPERFTGYHTGLDFETFVNEQKIDVAINVICSGKILRAGYASGYGGYVVQACVIDKQNVTVIYGHLRQSSIKPGVGQTLKAGDHLAVLGTGYSKETDGERKHLHLSIHQGSAVNIKGYVQTKSELAGWLDPRSVLGL